MTSYEYNVAQIASYSESDRLHKKLACRDVAQTALHLDSDVKHKILMRMKNAL